MQFKTFLAKLNVRIGEYENRVSLLLVANSLSAANELLDSAAALYLTASSTRRSLFARRGAVADNTRVLDPV